MSTELNLDTREILYVARQPILDARGVVFGYELLYRDAPGGPAEDREDLAGARVLSDAVLTLGLETITGGKPAFLNLTRPLLLRLAALLPPSAAVFELQHDIPVDDETFEVCRSLHASGYALGLDGFAAGGDQAALLPYVRFVKVDVSSASAASLQAVARELAESDIKLIADHADTPEAFAAAQAAGFHLFQGLHVSRPTVCEGTAVPGRQLAYLKLLAALNRPDITLSEVEDLVKHDVSLSYRVLRCVNSAAFGVQREVHSIRQALLLLGLAPVRSWASVWCVAGLNTGGVSEHVTTVLIRGRCCELLGERYGRVDGSADLFLIGLCSMLDAMLGKPMADAVADLPLAPAARAALLGEPNLERLLLDAVVAYEQGEWEEADAILARAGIPGDTLADAYTKALRWTREISA